MRSGLLEPQRFASRREMPPYRSRYISKRSALRDGVADDFVVHVGDVHDVVELKSAARNHRRSIRKRRKCESCRCARIVDGGSAGVHAHRVLRAGAKAALPGSAYCRSARPCVGGFVCSLPTRHKRSGPADFNGLRPRRNGSIQIPATREAEPGTQMTDHEATSTARLMRSIQRSISRSCSSEAQMGARCRIHLCALYTRAGRRRDPGVARLPFCALHYVSPDGQFSVIKVSK